MNILDILSPVEEDNSITKIEIHSYNPYSTSSLNKNDEIRIPVQNQSSFILPYQSYLYIEGKVGDITPSTVTQIEFTKNFIAFLFNEIRLEMGSQRLDQVKNPGIVTTMKNYISQSYAEKQSNRHLWFSENLKFKKNDTFNYCVPLAKYLGFIEDYRRVIIFAKLELILLRSQTDNNCIVKIPAAGAAASSVDIVLKKIQWRVPHVEVNNLHKLKLLKVLESGQKIYMPFRSWQYFENPALPTADKITWQIQTTSATERPLYVILGFQTARRNDSTKDATVFDHCKLTNAKLFLNTQQIPYENLNINYGDNQYSVAYNMFCNFMKSYYGKDDVQQTSLASFKTESPLIVFDCSRTESLIKSSSIDVRLELEFGDSLPASTVASVLVIHDQVFAYNPFTSIVEKVI